MKSGRIWTHDLENLMYHVKERKYFKYIEPQSQSPRKNLTSFETVFNPNQ